MGSYIFQCINNFSKSENATGIISHSFDYLFIFIGQGKAELISFQSRSGQSLGSAKLHTTWSNVFVCESNFTISCTIYGIGHVQGTIACICYRYNDFVLCIIVGISNPTIIQFFHDVGMFSHIRQSIINCSKAELSSCIISCSFVHTFAS